LLRNTYAEMWYNLSLMWYKQRPKFLIKKYSIVLLFKTCQMLFFVLYFLNSIQWKLRSGNVIVTFLIKTVISWLEMDIMIAVRKRGAKSRSRFQNATFTLYILNFFLNILSITLINLSFLSIYHLFFISLRFRFSLAPFFFDTWVYL